MIKSLLIGFGAAASVFAYLVLSLRYSEPILRWTLWDRPPHPTLGYGLDGFPLFIAWMISTAVLIWVAIDQWNQRVK